MSGEATTHDEYRVMWGTGIFDGPFDTEQDALAWCKNWPDMFAEFQQRTVTVTVSDWRRAAVVGGEQHGE